MPFNRKDYPANWEELRQQRLEMAGHCCEWCGAPNLAWIVRHPKPTEYREIEVLGQQVTKPYGDFDVLEGLIAPTPGWIKELGLKRVVLTTAHLDRSLTNHDISNLRSLCQRCHLNHDRAAQHLPNRRYGRQHTRPHQTKLELPC